MTRTGYAAGDSGVGSRPATAGSMQISKLRGGVAAGPVPAKINRRHRAGGYRDSLRRQAIKLSSRARRRASVRRWTSSLS